mmetsp:Transcript_22110/g.77488  ORF Transcript_22110/g.77488 Transcript_22110/m.77488 type:complete len:94 (+) Transcript_22110:83-364(+)
MDEVVVHARRPLAPRAFATAVATFVAEQATRAEARDAAAMDASAAIVQEEGEEDDVMAMEDAGAAAAAKCAPVASSDVVDTLERLVGSLTGSA